MNIYDDRRHYKPFEYTWAFDAFKEQNQIHWLPEEVSLHEDINDWENNLKPSERRLLTSIFRFFTQGDLDIARGYYEKYIPRFPKPEIRMMLGAFAAMEGVHAHAYSLIIDTVGMKESVYQEFLGYQSMRNKHEYLVKSGRDILEEIAIFSAFGEGLQLFSSFAILLSFPNRGLMGGMGQIITWSIRDESLHVESLIRLYRTILHENPELWTKELKCNIYVACRKMVELEDHFMELCFEEGDLLNLTLKDTKQYIRYLADHRLKQLGLKEVYRCSNPLPWLEETLSLGEHANFFEVRSTEYSKGAINGSWGDLWGSIDNLR